MYSIKTRTVDGVTWLFARLPEAVIQNSNRPDYIQPTLGGVEMRVGRDPTEGDMECAIIQMEAYLHQRCAPYDDRDTYLVRGYEIFERTARRQGNSAAVQVPAKYVGARFRVVRLDPVVEEE